MDLTSWASAASVQPLADFFQGKDEGRVETRSSEMRATNLSFDGNEADQFAEIDMANPTRGRQCFPDPIGVVSCHVALVLLYCCCDVCTVCDLSLVLFCG